MGAGRARQHGGVVVRASAPEASGTTSRSELELQSDEWASASPATGSAKAHALQTEDISNLLGFCREILSLAMVLRDARFVNDCEARFVMRLSPLISR